MLTRKGNKKICPMALIFNGDKLLIGLRHYVSENGEKLSVWTIPGGRCNEEETMGAALQRELAEEIGITNFKITEFVAQIAGAKKGDIVYMFKVETEKEPKLLEPEKFSEWKWSAISEIPSNFINREALDLISKNFKSNF
ncbi:NUDIX hydrolase [Patescibacteria group bacterium]|nr:NUDIX hydrolase [Patescibacteria group bacterium]